MRKYKPYECPLLLIIRYEALLTSVSIDMTGETEYFDAKEASFSSSFWNEDEEYYDSKD